MINYCLFVGLNQQVDAWGNPVSPAGNPNRGGAGISAMTSGSNLGQMVNDPWAPSPPKPAGCKCRCHY